MKFLRWAIGALIIVATLSYIMLGIKGLSILQRFVAVLFFAGILCFYRIVAGPTPADRIVGVDIFGILIIGACALMAAITLKSFFIDIGMAWALQSFVGSIALAKFLEGRHLDD